jgi:hypothetical protein
MKIIQIQKLFLENSNRQHYFFYDSILEYFIKFYFLNPNKMNIPQSLDL